jgi:hypothetical protein
MSRLLRNLLLLVACGVATFTVAAPDAYARGYRWARQYYSAWNYYQTGNYYYCCYHYLPTQYATTYSYHYVIQYPTQPQYYYYYNPHRQVFWGRSSSDPQANPGYSLLAAKDRKGRLEEIPESAFGPLGELPSIPESNDGARLELPDAGHEATLEVQATPAAAPRS